MYRRGSPWQPCVPCPPQSQGPLVFSSSTEGGVSVWQNLCSHRDPLRLLHHWSAQVTGCGGQRDGRLTLSPRGDRVFLADGRAWLKILHWRTGELLLQRWCIHCNGDGFWDFEKGCRNICIIPPSNICPLFTGMVSKLANHSSITGVTDCAHQTGGLLIGSCYDLANGEHSLNCEWQVDVQSKISCSPAREWNHCSAINIWAFRSLFSICSASVSVPGLSDLARCPQNHLYCNLDHRERRPPVGHWRTQPPCMGAAPEFRKAEVSIVHVIAPIFLKI